jgi:hypothetical protein
MDGFETRDTELEAMFSGMDLASKYFMMKLKNVAAGTIHAEILARYQYLLAENTTLLNHSTYILDETSKMLDQIAEQDARIKELESRDQK